MEPLKLSEQEARVYAELFNSCDVENTQKVTGPRASELFLSSGLSQEVLHQITELCGAKRLGHFGRSQFYIALKLITLAQHGMPFALESFNTGVDMPLPKFARPLGIPGYNQHPVTTEQEFNAERGQQQQQQQQQQQPGMMQQTAGLPPPPPAKRHHPPSALIHGYDQPVPTNPAESPQDGLSPPFSPNSDSPPMSPGHHPKVEPVAKQQPPLTTVITNQYAGSGGGGGGGGGANFPPNSQVENITRWASFEDEEHGLLSEETKSEKWAHFSDQNKADTSSISSEAESIDDVWSITDEQREYYMNQFATMQPDRNGVISGAVAKEFFEKSRLPVRELSLIWQLSDVDRDGCLSLEEFCIAMHLVVLRRNDIELPEHLPPALLPYVPLVNINPEEPFGADLPQGSTLKRPSSTTPSPTPATAPTAPPQPNQQWTTTFPAVESPSSSAVSSPGNSKPTPVKFDFQQPVLADPDSKIIHPIAMRMSPDGHAVPIDMDSKPRTYSVDAAMETVIDPSASPGPGDGLPSTPTKPRSYSLVDGGGDYAHPLPLHQSTPLHGRPRPTPKKAQSLGGAPVESQGQPRLLPPPSQNQDGTDRPTTLGVGGGDPDAPPPPPRKGHSRSSSLDNQLVDLSDHSQQSKGLMPPVVPPRPSPKEGSGSHKLVSQSSEPGPHQFVAVDPSGDTNFADFSKFPTIPSQEVLNVTSSEGQPGVVNTDKHRRSMSLGAAVTTSNTGFLPYQVEPGPGSGEITEGQMPVVATEHNRPVTPPGGGLERMSSREDETDRTTRKNRILQRQGSVDKKDLQATIRKQRERNMMLSRLNGELNQELQDVMEQRIALEIQLENLQPFSS